MQYQRQLVLLWYWVGAILLGDGQVTIKSSIIVRVGVVHGLEEGCKVAFLEVDGNRKAIPCKIQKQHKT